MNMDLIEKPRDINVGDDFWHESIREDWAVKLRELGVDTDAKMIQFSGFCSQGDGACFTGTLDLPKFVAAHHMDYPFIALAAKTDLERRVVLSHRGNYCHENSVGYEFYTEEPDTLLDETDLFWQVLLAAYNQTDLRALESDVKDICQGYMRDIYRELEQEYDYQTSDEAVWDTLVANEITEEEEEDAA